MHEIAGWARRLATTWRGDLVLAICGTVWSIAVLAVAAERGLDDWAALLCALPYCVAVAIRRRWPLVAAVLASAGVLTVRPLGQTGIVNGWFADPFVWALFLFCYSLGTSAGILAGLAGVGVLTVSTQIEQVTWAPLVYLIIIGSWAGGRIALSRARMTKQLEARNTELRAEHELFAAESIRYERARIARELHDIVAHCLSVMVVQASAGQRVPDSDRDGMAQALASVAEAAAQAQEEIGRLVELLAAEPEVGTSANLQMIDELVSRAVATGLQVSCQFSASFDDLSPAASQAAYRVVQEAMTNALKHAPGAPVTVTIGTHGRQVAVSVLNSAPRDRPSGLEGSGGQHGLAAMRERVMACGGSLNAGPAADGGWQVRAVLPLQSAR
jgi:signal transduction histidine kinase